MIASEATLPNKESIPVHAEILSYVSYQGQRADLPSIVTFLSQGATFGALLAFLWPVIGMLSHPGFPDSFIWMGALPVCLGGGALFGLCEATVLWAGTFGLGHRIHPIIRAVLGPVILVIFIGTYSYLFSKPSPYRKEVSTTDYLFTIGVYAGCGVVLGLVIGSRIRPIYELIRGTASEQLPVMNALTGLALRPIVIFGLMLSILVLILSTQGDFHQREFMMSLIAVLHFALAVTIMFARMPFWLLLPLALIINFPVVALITDVLKVDDLFLRVVTFTYLALWTGFLLFRASVPLGVLDFIKRELRYYFID
jgi:hypothetical protein